MKVLVTGGAGFIGSCVVDELLKRDHQVRVLDSFIWGKESLKDVENKIELVQGDCRNSRDVIYALEGIDAVIHLAGIVGEAACLKNPKAHFSANVESTRTLVNCCTDPEGELVRDILFASSCSVYGNVQGMYEKVIETTPTNPLSAYAFAKLKAEEILLERNKQVPHFHPTILRLTTVFGWSKRPRLDLVTNLFAYKAWKYKKLMIFGDGKQYRSLVNTKDIARAFVDVLEVPRFMRSGQIFHVGEENNNKTVKEIAEMAQTIQPGTQVEFKTDTPTDRRDYFIDCTKIRNVIGWKAQVTVEEGMKEIIQKFEEGGFDWDSDNLRNNKYDYS